MPLPERDDMFMTKGRLEEEIMVSLGGRIAEQLIFDEDVYKRQGESGIHDEEKACGGKAAVCGKSEGNGGYDESCGR